MQITICMKTDRLDLHIGDRLVAENISMVEALSHIDRAYTQDIHGSAELINQYIAAAEAGTAQTQLALERIKEVCAKLEERHSERGGKTNG